MTAPARDEATRSRAPGAASARPPTAVEPEPRAEAGSDCGVPRWRLQTTSVRTRVIVAVVTLTAVALIVSGAVVVVAGRIGAERQIIDHQRAGVTALRQLASELDPQTRQPWTSAEALLKVAVQRAALDTGEGVLALVGGQIVWTAQPGVALRPENDPALLDVITPLAGQRNVTFGRLTTAQRTWRYVVIPVSLPGSATEAALVRAVDVERALAPLRPAYTAYIIVAAGSLILVGLTIWLLVGRLLRPIATVRRTADRITRSDLTQRIPVNGHDDLSALAQTINSMLDRLAALAEEQRQLLDDVGHELRTPLTIARGHLELIDFADPTEGRASRDVALSELDRMRRLVDDLLTLARSAQPSLLRPELTDLVQLTDDTLTKATTLGPRRWQLDSVAEVTTWLDPQRISQAWLQLAANAVQYSAPGSEVGLGSAVDRGELRLWVRDQGQGIAPADQPRIFERRERGSLGQGTGLGLAIVHAIATSHGGRVDLDSRLGEGSTFTMRLPLRESA